MAYAGLTRVTSAARLGLWFWGIHLARGVWMALAVLPIILTLRNVSLGVTSVLLLRPRSVRIEASVPAASSATD